MVLRAISQRTIFCIPLARSLMESATPCTWRNVLPMSVWHTFHQYFGVYNTCTYLALLQVIHCTKLIPSCIKMSRTAPRRWMRRIYIICIMIYFMLLETTYLHRVPFDQGDQKAPQTVPTFSCQPREYMNQNSYLLHQGWISVKKARSRKKPFSA